MYHWIQKNRLVLALVLSAMCILVIAFGPSGTGWVGFCEGMLSAIVVVSVVQKIQHKKAIQ
ncbi:hypothetical protein [Niabella aquatica]